MKNELYILERYNNKTKEYRYLNEVCECKKDERNIWMWEENLSDAKIFRSEKEAIEYEEIFNESYISMTSCEDNYKDCVVRKRKLLVEKENIEKIPCVGPEEIF